MRTASQTIAAGAASALVLAGGAAGLAGLSTSTAYGDEARDMPVAAVDAEASSLQAARVSAAVVEGDFSFVQTEVASNEWIYRNLAEGSRYLCGARASETAGAERAEDWVLTVDGAVEKGYSATMQEIASTGAVQSVIMGCSCLGNPADGRAAANALVEGISALTLVTMACPEEGANTVVFTSSDGYQVALPLSYIQTHHCPVVFNVNGSRLEQSVGGTNQLWLGSTPASYFVRDVVSITLEERETPPASPTSDEARASYAANLPNVGVLLGGEVA